MAITFLVPIPPETLRGAGWLVVEPDPTCPQLFCPQANTLRKIMKLDICN